MATYDSALRLAHANKLDFSATFLYYLDNITWRVIPLLKSPVQVNYSIDDSSDNASISFISTTLTTKLDNGTFMTLVYAPNTTTKSLFGIPAYNGNKPSNHDVMVIKSGNCKRKGNSAYYYHEYVLVELIELMKDVTMETLTFTSDTQVTVRYVGGSDVTYYKAPYNAYTILQRILTQTKTPTIEVNETWLNKISIVDYTYLIGQMVGVDDTFTENTLYDALIKLGGYLGRVPVLYFKADYDGTNQKYYLYFEKRDINRTTPVTLASLRLNATDYIEDDDSPIANSIVANTSNLIGSKLIYYPSKNQYAPANNKDSEALTVTRTSDLAITLEYPISQVKLVRRKKTIKTDVLDFDTEEVIETSYSETYLDIPCYKYEDWLVQDDKDNKAYFKENENVVYLGTGIKNTNQGIGGTTYVVTYTYYYYQVQAYTNIQANAVVGDGEFTQFFNQVDSLVDSETFGQQLKNYQQANTGLDLIVSKIVDNYSDILTVGQLVTSGSIEYLVSSVGFNTIKMNGATKYKVAYKLNQDYVKRNNFVKGSSEIRKYQTYYENTHERLVNIKESINVKILMGDISTSQSLNTFNYIQDNDVIFGGMLSSDEYGAVALPCPEVAIARTITETYTNEALTTDAEFRQYIQFNTNKTVLGNSVLVNLRTLTNVSIGNQIGLPNSSGVATQRPTIYTDPFGNVSYLQVALVPAYDEITLNNNFPVIDATTYTTLYNTSDVRYQQIYLNKDSREILNLTLQYEFVPVGLTKISSDLLQYSGLMGTRDFAITYDETIPSPIIDTDVLQVAQATIGLYDIGDMIASPTLHQVYFIEKTGVNIKMTLAATLTKGSYDYFIVNKIGANYKVIAKIDSSGVTNGASIGAISICY